MKEIQLSGVIGIDVTPKELKKEIDSAAGTPILFTINSPGGSVFAGLELYSMIRNYPGETETRLVSLGASMGSIIALAGKRRTAESHAVFFIHHPWTAAAGNHKDLKEASEMIKSLSDHLASLYSEATGISKSKILEYMDADSWFYGNELEEFGFKMIQSSANKSAHARTMAIEKARVSVSGCSHYFTDEAMKSDLMKAAALLNSNSSLIRMPGKTTTPGVTAQQQAEIDAWDRAYDRAPGKKIQQPEIRQDKEIDPLIMTVAALDAQKRR